MAKTAEEATNARLASVSIMDWVIFLRTKQKKKKKTCREKLTVVQTEIAC